MADIIFVSFPCEAWGKWYHRNDELLRALGLSKSMQEKTTPALASTALRISVGIVHVSVSKARAVVSPSLTTEFQQMPWALGSHKPADTRHG